MDDPDLEPEMARSRSRLTSLEAERAELVSRLAGLALIRRPPGRLSRPLGERSDPALRLCPGLCERMGEGDVRQTASEVRRVPEPGLHMRAMDLSYDRHARRG